MKCWVNGLVWSSWWTYNTANVSTDKDETGVYELGDENKNTVYYGSGKVKTRLLDHINKKECPLARYYRVEYMSDTDARKREQQLLEDYKKTHNEKLPIYNERVG